MIKIAIIGAGVGGLAAATAGLEEGSIPVVFDESNDIGGVWSTDRSSHEQHGKAWPGMQVNISRYTGKYSNFNWSEDKGDFPTTQEFYQYLKDYVEHNHLEQYLRLGCKVVEVSFQNEKWLVKWKKGGEEFQEEFDAVINSTGRNQRPVIPEIKGIEKIKGKMVHSANYVSTKDFIGQRVLVVGGSFSGTSIAEDLSLVADVNHLIRKPRWIIKRYKSSDPQNKGAEIPHDLTFTMEGNAKILTQEEGYQNMLLHCAEQNEIPEWKMELTTPVGFAIGDHYVERVKEKKIKVMKGEIDYFEENAVILKDQTKIEFDKVILCTGYAKDLSHLPQNLQHHENVERERFEDIFPLEAKNLPFLSMYPSIRNAVPPVVEIQARYACKVFSGKIKLPTVEEMKEEMANTPLKRKQLDYMNSVAKRMGILPESKYNYENAADLAHILWRGAFTPMRFRLQEEDKRKRDEALKLLKEVEYMKREKEHAKDHVPTLAELCKRKLNTKK